MNRHFLTHVGSITVFADRIDGFSNMKIVMGCSSPRFAEFTVYLTNGTSFMVEGEEKIVAAEQAHLLEILDEQESFGDDDDHPMGQSG